MSGGPIFVLGITGRSGTNFLRDLLALHPDCVKAREPFWEDFFLDESDALVGYARRLARRWRSWTDEDPAPELLARLGSALVDFVTPYGGARVVTKTPSTRNLDRFFDLFPDATLLVIVRDPRSVVASAVRSFEADYEGWARQWARGAARIVAFDDAQRAARAARYRIVRYEDLVVDLDAELRAIFAVAGLDAARYDFGAAAALPARGSSQLAEGGDLHWRPVERDASFDPLRRWADWPASRLDRIAWLTAPYAERLGYDVGSVPGGLSRAAHRVRDAGLVARLALRGVGRRRRHPSSPRAGPGRGRG